MKRVRHLLFALTVGLSVCLAIYIRPDSGVPTPMQKASDNSLAGLKGILVTGSGQEKGSLASIGITNDWITQTAELRARKNGIKVLSTAEYEKAPGIPFLNIAVSTSRHDQQIKGLFAVSIRIDVMQLVSLVRDPAKVLMASTWQDGTYGTVGVEKLRSSIEDLINDQMDKFSNTFLAKNPK